MFLTLQTSISLLVGVGWRRRLLGLLLLVVALWLSITDGKGLHVEAMEASNTKPAQFLSGPKAQRKRTQIINLCRHSTVANGSRYESRLRRNVVRLLFLEFRLLYLAISGPG